MAAPGVHLRQARVRPAAMSNPTDECKLPLMLPLAEVEARYQAALAVPFPSEEVTRLMPRTWEFCKRAGQALSAHPANILLALVQMAGFEMPKVVVAYTALLDVSGLQWNLPLDRTGGGKSLVVTFIKEIEKLRQGQLQRFYDEKHELAMQTWRETRLRTPHLLGPKPEEPKVKTVCDAGSLVACRTLCQPPKMNPGATWSFMRSKAS
jgi:hypothetical protein